MLNSVVVMSNRLALSSSNSQLRHSTRSSSNSSSRRSQSTQKGLSPLPPGVKDGGVSQRRSASASRITTQTQSKRTTPLSAQNHAGTDMVNTAVDTNVGIQTDENLDTSTASVATEEMDTSPQQTTTLNDATPVTNNTRSSKGTINKDQLVEQFFIRLNTGGYYCKLCQGTKDQDKVSKSYYPNNGKQVR